MSDLCPAPGLFAPLVSSQWLADHLGADHLVVVDATVTRAQPGQSSTGWISGSAHYANEHIRGALFADLITDFSDPDAPFEFTRPDSARFRAAATRLGIDNETSVVVYDSAQNQWAARLWWLFRSFGYESVAVLDGGLRKWVLEGRTVAGGSVESHSAGEFEVREVPGVWASKPDVERIVRGEAAASLVCASPAKDFAGARVGHTRAGHIPRSVSAPIGQLISPDTNAFLPVVELRAAFGEVLSSDNPIVTYCGAGIAASLDALALTLLGRSDVAVYDGSLAEWTADPLAPLTSEA